MYHPPESLSLIEIQSARDESDLKTLVRKTAYFYWKRTGSTSSMLNWLKSEHCVYFYLNRQLPEIYFPTYSTTDSAQDQVSSLINFKKIGNKSKSDTMDDIANEILNEYLTEADMFLEAA